MLWRETKVPKSRVSKNKQNYLNSCTKKKKKNSYEIKIFILKYISVKINSVLLKRNFFSKTKIM